MKLTVLGSSSQGNSYILHNESTALILEVGCRLSEVKKALDFNISKIAGALVTHEHKDHFGYVHDYLKAGIDVFCSQGTAEALLSKHHRLHIVPALLIFRIGEFTIMAFNVEHDAAEPYGYIINHKDTGNILFVTDSYFSEYTFADLNNVILEVNYDLEILDANISSGKLHPSVRNRIITSHMELNTAIDLLLANDLSKVNNIVLIHLSDGNSHAINFKKQIESATGINVTIADKGTEIEFNKTPF